MQTIPGALPDRLIAVTPPGKQSSRLTAVLFSLVFPAICAVLVWSIGGPLYRDLFGLNNLRPAQQVQFLEGRCQTKAFLLTLCSLKIVDTAPGGVGATSFQYFMLDLGDRRSATVLRSASDPSRVTTDIGQDQLINRLLTFGGMMAFLGWLSAMILIATRKAGIARTQFAGLSTQPLEAGLVEITKVEEMKTLRIWRYMWNDGGKDHKHSLTLPKEVPILLASNSQAVAVRARTGGIPMLLDADAWSLSLTPPEKAHFVATVANAMRTPAPTISPVT